MLVVDDNPSDRSGICSLPVWSELGIEIVGSCANGASALALVKEKKIDIVLTDIAMPIMNGIELAEKIKEDRLNTKIVFMSCYSDFDYARSAMDLDIYGYVLKPLIPGELQKAMKKLLDEYVDEENRIAEKEVMARQIRDMLPMVQEQFLKELLLGSCFQQDEIQMRMDYLQMKVDPGINIVVGSLLIEDFDKQTAHLAIEDKYYITYSIKNIIHSQSSAGAVIQPIQFSGCEYSFIIFNWPDLAAEPPFDIMDAAVCIHSSILFDLKLNTTIGISNRSRDISNASDLYRQSIAAVNTPLYGGINPIVRYELLESGTYAAPDQTVNLEELYRQLKDLVTAGKKEGYRSFIDSKFRAEDMVLPETYVKSLAFSIVNMTVVILMEDGYSIKDVLGSDTAIWEKVSRLKTLSGVRQLLMGLFTQVDEYLASKSSSRNTKVVESIKLIIKARYREQINVEDISRTVYLSQGYANALFKKETGKSIFDFLLQYRLEKAKSLLMDSDSKVSVVSESVGYDNKSYFSLMFKKYVGISPSDFKTRFAR